MADLRWRLVAVSSESWQRCDVNAQGTKESQTSHAKAKAVDQDRRLAAIRHVAGCPEDLQPDAEASTFESAVEHGAGKPHAGICDWWRRVTGVPTAMAFSPAGRMMSP